MNGAYHSIYIIHLYVHILIYHQYGRMKQTLHCIGERGCGNSFDHQVYWMMNPLPPMVWNGLEMKKKKKN